VREYVDLCIYSVRFHDVVLSTGTGTGTTFTILYPRRRAYAATSPTAVLGGSDYAGVFLPEQYRGRSRVPIAEWVLDSHSGALDSKKCNKEAKK
jgi:hypothetical protein